MRDFSCGLVLAKPVVMSDVQQFLIEETDISLLERAAKRLFTETRLTGDEMRDLAQALAAVAARAREIPLP